MLSIFDELKARGVEKLGFVCIDGLAGLEEAITNTFPNAIVCRCMVHLVRNSTKYIPTKHRKEFCADLKAIYGAVSISEAENALAVLNEKWKKQYPSAVRVWNDNFIYVQRIFEYPSEIRKMIYTTNTIESFNSSLRKVTDRKAAFPNEMAVMRYSISVHRTLSKNGLCLIRTGASFAVRLISYGLRLGFVIFQLTFTQLG